MIHSFTPHILLNIYCVPGTVLDADKDELPPAFPKLLGRDPGRPRWMGLWHTVSLQNIWLPVLFGGGEQRWLSAAKGHEGLVILGAQCVNAFVNTLQPVTPLGTSL